MQGQHEIKVIVPELFYVFTLREDMRHHKCEGRQANWRDDLIMFPCSGPDVFVKKNRHLHLSSPGIQKVPSSTSNKVTWQGSIIHETTKHMTQGLVLGMHNKKHTTHQGWVGFRHGTKAHDTSGPGWF